MEACDTPVCELCGATNRDADLGYFRVTTYHYRTACYDADACRERMVERDADTDRKCVERQSRRAA